MPTNQNHENITRRTAIAATAAAIAAPAMPALAEKSPLSELIAAEAKAREISNASFERFEELEGAEIERQKNLAPRLVKTLAGNALDVNVIGREDGLAQIERQAAKARTVIRTSLDGDDRRQALAALDRANEDAKTRWLAGHDALDAERSPYLEAKRRNDELSRATWETFSAILAYPPRNLDEVRVKARFIAKADQDGRLGSLEDGEALLSSYLAIAADA